jgi:hypothetical protein
MNDRTRATWLLHRCESAKFPYRVQVLDARGIPLLSLRVQDRWPAANRNIFCLRDEPGNDAGVLEEIERVPVIAYQRRGVRISVVLDRARYKRCDFLFVTRSHKGRPDEAYEQIFWQTQTSMAQRRPRITALSARVSGAMTVRIAHDERYPWSFPGATVDRGKLACGDYALLCDEEVTAVVERKTFDNLLADFRSLPTLHQRALELAAQRHHALVIEAPYEDFLNPKRLHHYSAAFCAATIAELYAAHPGLRIVFCANRRAANQWTANSFAAVHRLIAEASQTEVGRTPNREPAMRSTASAAGWFRP